MPLHRRALGCLVATLTALSASAEAPPRPPSRTELARYPWLTQDKVVRPLEAAIAPPSGYTR